MSMSMLITYPKSIKIDTYEFHINDDDMNKQEAKSLSDFITSKGFNLKRSKRYSDIKLMSWYVFKIKSESHLIRSFEDNIKFCEELVKEWKDSCLLTLSNGTSEFKILK